MAWARDTARVEPNPAEIDEVFRVPLDELLSPDVPRLEASDENELVMSAPLQRLGNSRFAPTAAILYQFRDVAFNGRATRGQPRFAWK
ncbi:MAG: hypothetical protein ACOC9Q_02495 [bacterium]